MHKPDREVGRYTLRLAYVSYSPLATALAYARAWASLRNPLDPPYSRQYFGELTPTAALKVLIGAMFLKMSLKSALKCQGMGNWYLFGI